MSNKIIEKAIELWHYLKFLINHDHYFVCTTEPLHPNQNFSGYWHIERCWCKARQITLNGWCDGHQI